ncbi:LPS-assembly protein LptD [bacterium]|nr:LPS-assembly protein LptD [bacterium]
MRLLALLLLSFALAGLLCAQETLDQDTTKQRDGVDTVITYFADAIDFDVSKRVTVLTGNARLLSRDRELEAGRIDVNWDSQTLTATAIEETLFVDSARTEIDTVMLIGKPHFKQSNEDFTGDEIAYNLKSKMGRVKGGRTAYQDGSYYGEQFKRLSDDALSVRHGEFTTCELDTPHFHFGADILKIEVGRRVIARPVYLYFADVPVLALPYGVFPVQKGRTSGLTTPVFGESASQGRFLRNIGYYWATSDYMDVLGSFDYYEERGILGGADYRYAKKYKLDGRVAFDFDTQRSGEVRKRMWKIEGSHNQTIDQTTRLNVAGSYVSDKSYNRSVGTTQDQLNQTVQSNATLSKSWTNSPWSASVNARFTQNIEKETWTAGAPGVNFTHKQGRLFPAPKAPRGIRFATAPRESKEPWYRAFTWTYRAAYSNDLAKTKTLREDGLQLSSEPNSAWNYTATIIRQDSSHLNDIWQRDGVSHQGSFGATARLFKYVNLSPGLDWKHVWSQRVVHYVPQDTILDRRDETGFFTRTTFGLGSSASTKLYGLAKNPLGIQAQFRHVMTPSVSFRFTPDFSDEEWGYYKTATLPDGRTYEYDRFGSDAASGVVGGTPRGLSEALSFSLQNLFQMKTGNAEDENEKRLDLLSANFSTGVDFKKDSLQWSDISGSFRTQTPGRIIGPLEAISFDVQTTHSLYQRSGYTLTNQFYWDRAGAKWYTPIELTRMSANIGFSLRAEKFSDLFVLRGGEANIVDTTKTPELPLNPAGNPFDKEFARPVLPQSNLKDVETFVDMPISLQIAFRQSRDFVSDTKTSVMGTNLSTSLTPRWDVSMDYNFDLDRRIAQNSGVSITRDLHCWEASLRWSPVGYSPGYYLRIGLKSSQLQDVKIERNRGGNLGGFR